MITKTNKTSLLIRVILLACLLAITVPPSPVIAQSADPGGQEPFSGEPLCLPNAYVNDPEDCLPLGPSLFLSEMARQGISYPPRPLPAASPDPSLNLVDIQYAKINADASEPVAIYGSLEDASTGNNPLRYIQGGMLRFVSYTNRVDIDSAHFIQLRSGEWMRASPSVITDFQGLQFFDNPSTPFGWIVEAGRPRTGPGYEYPEIEKDLPRELVVQIYQMQKGESTDWYRIGLNEWVERRYIREVRLNPEPPQGVDNQRWIEINLYEQTLMVYENGRLIFATLIASGVDPFFTQPGLFKIYKKKPTETMSGAFEADKSDYYYLEDVPWTMYFDKARALHGAYWRTMFGYPQSHGCVNLSIGDSRWLYDWAKEGDWVYVWDPTGQTPTDPAAYTDGGA